MLPVVERIAKALFQSRTAPTGAAGKEMREGRDRERYDVLL